MGYGGKGKGKGGGSWDWNPFAALFGGKGWGKNESITRRAHPDKRVWIGGLPENSASKELNKKLKDHLSQAPGCKFVEVNRKGSGCAVFGNKEEATAAISLLNGSVFDGSVLELDVWTKKEKSS
eukprot:TRINITY_DN28829_c0_g3_i1.p1 TRINITY_DN28829_c0_g3~~TRINITY_DN28829_c0_g3_i1.p1  ORF type:complete len:124 (-),score=39.69 TRINITY_DN28829_c0_g3_i1:103-474(-)